MGALPNGADRLTTALDIIKGFAAHAPASALEFVTTMGEQYKVEIEEDGIVTTQGEE